MSSRSSVDRAPGVQEVMGSIPVWDSDFSLSHAHVMLNQKISYFTVPLYFGIFSHGKFPISLRDNRQIVIMHCLKTLLTGA